MSTDTTKSADEDTTPTWVANLWEKVTDSVTAFFDGAGKVLTRMMGSSNERYVRKLGYIRPNKPGATAHRRSRLAPRPGQRARREDARPHRRASCAA